MDKRPIDQKLQSLVGVRIIRFSGGEGALAFFFENGSVLTIYAPFRISSIGASDLDPSQVVGRSLEGVACSTARVLMEIENQIRLEIDLDVRKMTGPEHLQLRSQSGEITIWS